MPSIKFYSPPFSAPFIRNQSSNNAGKLQSYLTAIFFACIFLTHFAERKLPCPSFPFPAKPVSTVIIAPPQHLVGRFAPAGHISLLFAIQEAKESFILMWQCVSAFALPLPVNFVFLLASSPLPRSQPQSHISLRALFHLVYMLSLQPSAFHPSHLSEGNPVLLPVASPVQMTVEEQSPLCSPRDAYGHWRSGPQQVSPVEAEHPCLYTTACSLFTRTSVFSNRIKMADMRGRVRRNAGSSFLPPTWPQRWWRTTGRTQDCAQHMADRVDLRLEEAPWDPLEHGAVALERKCGERRWDTNGLLN